ncbi:MAG: hypothetical protein IJM30_08485 [Thermoguttaceae bacterium]|nr:hypothetical protein [Thermoguttaceae bacterium]
MWLFTKRGFFSAVQNCDDSKLIHVRARFKGDLERLCEAYRLEPSVASVPGADYPYRMDFPRETWASIVKSEAEEIDYPNFKNAVHEGTDRDAAYMSVWFELKKRQN